MGKIWVAVWVFLLAMVSSPPARAHQFTSTSPDGCCTWTYDHCTARPGHPEERCRPGHHQIKSEFHLDGLDCIGVACAINPTCFPDVATGEDQEIADGIDNDCDGFVDDEQCDGEDNDNDGMRDEDLGSCLLKVLVVPLCFEGGDAAFETAARLQMFHFFRMTGMQECPDNTLTEVIVPSEFEASCSGSGGSCENFTSRINNQIVAAGIDQTQFDFTVAITNQDICGSLAGQSSQNDVIWVETDFPLVLAHEVGHHFGLKDEYCSQDAALSPFAVDTRCNSGNPAPLGRPTAVNWLGEDLDCDPDLLSDCCGICSGYDVCCDGNRPIGATGQFSTPCIMAAADEDPGRGFCDRCFGHLQNPPNLRTETNPFGDAPLNCAFAHLGSVPIMRAAMTMAPDGTMEIQNWEVKTGRLGLSPTSPNGHYGLEVIAPGDVLMFATPFDAYFDSGDPKIAGLSYAGFERASDDLSFRIPVLPGNNNMSIFTLKTYIEGVPAGQTTINGRAPTANAGPDRVVECNQTLAATTVLDGSGSFDPDGDTLRYEWTGQGTFADPRARMPTVTASIGTPQFSLVVFDGLYRSAPDTVRLTIVDRTPPQVSNPGPIAIAGCAASNSFTFQPPTAVDICSPNVTVRGFVIRRNGVAVNPPTALVNNATTLTPGTYVIEWRATDQFNNETRISQTVTVRPALQTGNSLLLRDRARANQAPNVLGPIWNSGTSLTELGVEARSGNIVSVGPVSLRDRAVVSGSILTAGNVTRGNQTTVSGPITQFGQVVLPPLPTLPAFNPGTGSTIVNPGSPVALSAGPHGAFTVNTGGRLELSAGDHFFSSLTLNSSVAVFATAQTRVFVAGATILRSSFILTGTTNTLAPIFLGLATTSSVFVETAFDGTLVAPSAFVTFGIASGLTYRGLFYARNIEARPDTVLQCAATPIPQ